MKIDWDKVGALLPVVVQESSTNEILMLAYMNEEALNLSVRSGFAHYFSRTRNRIWKKGEESGNVQKIDEMFLDCDNDTLLIKVEQIGGVACHTGEKSCFFRKFEPIADTKDRNLIEKTPVKKPSYGIIDEVYHEILDRKLNGDPEKSYVASLFKKGENSILKKIGEEATELVTACKDASAHKNLAVNSHADNSSCSSDTYEKAKKDLIYEAADLCFHSLVALAAHNIHPSQIKEELARRFGRSGIEEKRSRDVK